MFIIDEHIALLGSLAVVFEILGVITAVRAVMSVRTSQGAIAWSVALLTFPIVSVPLYWVFGRSKFEGYVESRRSGNWFLRDILHDARPLVDPHRVDLGSEYGAARVLEQLTHLPFLSDNHAKLLINGEATFDAIFAGIDAAQDYILVEFFIIKDDELGRRFKDRLIRRAREGVRIYVLYDEMGSKELTKQYLRDLDEAGIKTSGMRTTKGWRNRFQLNFRNHRKIVVIDGHTAYVGGHNVGDEYLGKHPRLTPWRDTHIQVEGPAVLAVQLAFVEDWHWAEQEVLDVSWQPRPSESDQTMFILPSGPADEYETCGLFFTHAINSAQHRIWIASPYFVPDEAIMAALQLAAMRGVDVRILLPGMDDHILVNVARWTYVEEVTAWGVKVFSHGKGFMHQKVVLIDDAVSTVGTANFDNRSFRLNFEISVLVFNREFAGAVEEMLDADLACATLVTPEQLAARPYRSKVFSRIARLFSPIL